MNEEQLTKKERVASIILRILSMIGLVAVLSVVAWLIVHGVRQLPNASSGFGAAVSLVQSEQEQASSSRDAVLFNLESHTMIDSTNATVRWTYSGDTAPSMYTFSYSCTPGVTLAVQAHGTTSALACDTALNLSETEITVTPRSTAARYADVTINISGGAGHDSTLVTVVNAQLANNNSAATSSTAQAETPNTGTAVSSDASKTIRPAAKPVAVAAPIIPATPADIALQTVSAGILVPSGTTQTYFPLTTIPNGKSVSVRFTVGNVGGTKSEAWAFVAELPIEGNSSYQYVAPIQEPLAPGMQVTYTLTFDEVQRNHKDTVRITLKPYNKADPIINNVKSITFTTGK